MHFLIILALIYPLISTALDAQARQNIAGRHAMVTNVSNARLDSLRWFAIAANQYVKASPFTTTAITGITWDTMKASPSLPDSVKGLSVPSTWVVRGNSTLWAVCVPADDRLLVMSLTEQDIAAQNRGIKTTTAMPNVTFGVTGGSGVIGYLGEQANGTIQNVC